MTSLNKILIGTTISAGVIGIVSYFKGLQRIGAELETVLKSKVLGFDLKKGLTIQADVLLKNPSSRTLKFIQPTVKLLQKGKPVATSKVSDKYLVLPAFGEKQIDPIQLTIPAKDLLLMFGGVFGLLTKKQPIPLAVKVITNVDLGWKKQDFITSQDLTIKPKQA